MNVQPNGASRGYSFPEKRLLNRSKALGIPVFMVTPFVNSIDKWVKTNGREWTVDRLKSIKLDFIRNKAGLPPVSTWIKKDKSGLVTGSFHQLIHFGQVNDKTFSKVVSLLQAFTVFISKEVTPNQRTKFVDGVTAENTVIPKSLLNGIKTAWTHYHGSDKVKCGCAKPLWTRSLSGSRREPWSNGKTTVETVDPLGAAMSFMRSPLGHEIYRDFHNIYMDVTDGMSGQDWPYMTFFNTLPSVVGRISVIQEPGFKMRAVANPARIYQQMLGPLGKSIYRLLNDLPWDCTFDQSKGFPLIQSHLQSGEVAHSVDLSGATDYFPLQLQLELLRHVFSRTDYVDLFEKLSRSDWSFEDSTIAWSKGQPLGLYPSFGSFALTHGMLLYHLNGNHHGGDFFVLGDDVVILNDELAHNYRKTLDTLQCPVSSHKSISSSTLAEFGGKLLTPDHIIPQFKWRGASDDSFIDYLRNVGSRGLALLLPRQQKVAKAIWTVPDFFGGLGFNPDGISLEERVSDARFMWDKEEAKKYLMSYRSHISRINHPETDSHRNMLFRACPDAPDKEALAILSKHLPQFLCWYETLGRNLYSMDQDSVLPLEVQASRESLLQSLESKIGM